MKKVGILLLVPIVSIVMFAALVEAPPGPSVSVYPCTGVNLTSDTFVRVTGTGWTPLMPVTIYWDTQTPTDIVAVVTTSWYGGFSVNQLELEGMSVGVHTVIAVQGANTATAQFTVSSTVPLDDRIVDSMDSLDGRLDMIEENLGKVKVETLIYSPVLRAANAKFNITANQPWDLMAVYVTTYGFDTGDKYWFGIYQFGSRMYHLNDGVLVADEADVANFPLFPSDMTNGTQSVIAVPANVRVSGWFGQLAWVGDMNQSASLMIVIQRPIDPSFSYSVAWGWP